MLKYDTLRKLIECPDRDSVIHEVNMLSEEEAKVALIMTLLAWRFGNKMNEDSAAKLHGRIAELEKQLAAQLVLSMG